MQKIHVETLPPKEKKRNKYISKWMEERRWGEKEKDGLGKWKGEEGTHAWGRAIWAH